MPNSGTGVAAEAMIEGSKPESSTTRIEGPCIIRRCIALSARVCSRPKRKDDCRYGGKVVLSRVPSNDFGRNGRKLAASEGESGMVPTYLNKAHLANPVKRKLSELVRVDAGELFAKPVTVKHTELMQEIFTPSLVHAKARSYPR